jgi:LPXTG-motif cell wall-anchored protein
LRYLAGKEYEALERNYMTRSSGNVYVADTSNSRIQKFSSNGKFLAVWPPNGGVQVGNGRGEFSHPEGIATDSSGNVYVADTQNDRIQKFNSSGEYVTEWGKHGTGPGEVIQPGSVATDSKGNVYVTDVDRIQKFDSNGKFLTQWGGSGQGNGQFFTTKGVATDSSDNIYVVDSGHSRIQKFGYTCSGNEQGGKTPPSTPPPAPPSTPPPAGGTTAPNTDGDGSAANKNGGFAVGVANAVDDALGNIQQGSLPDTGGGWALLLLLGVVLVGGGWFIVRLSRRFSR